MGSHGFHKFAARGGFSGRARGFSLVEAAIVLVVIGVILGAVLQGRSLIESAEYKSFRQQLRETRTAFQSFRDRYGALPGDFTAADARIDSDAPVPSGANAGNGLIDDGPTCDAADNESCIAWQHLRYAGVLGGNPTLEGPAASPTHPFGGVIGGFLTGSGTFGQYGQKLLVETVPVDVARRLDREEDDDQCDDGRITGRTCDGTNSAEWPDTDTVDLYYAL